MYTRLVFICSLIGSTRIIFTVRTRFNERVQIYVALASKNDRNAHRIIIGTCGRMRYCNYAASYHTGDPCGFSAYSAFSRLIGFSAFSARIFFLIASTRSFTSLVGMVEDEWKYVNRRVRSFVRKIGNFHEMRSDKRFNQIEILQFWWRLKFPKGSSRNPRNE